MYKKILILLILVIECGILKAQEKDFKDYKVGISGGVAFYSEKDLKEINAEVLRNSPLTAEQINNFPPYFCYGAYILNRWGKKFAAGPAYNFYTTGSRFGLKDYSGSYSFDQIILAHSLGLQLELLVSKHSGYTVYLEAIAGAHFAKWRYNEELRVGGENISDKQDFSAIKPYIYPGLKFLWPVFTDYKVAFKGGYSVDLGGKFKNENAVANTRISFSGPRLTAILEYGF